MLIVGNKLRQNQLTHMGSVVIQLLSLCILSEHIVHQFHVLFSGLTKNIFTCIKLQGKYVAR